MTAAERERLRQRTALTMLLGVESRFLEQRNEVAHRRLLKILDRIDCAPDPADYPVYRGVKLY